MACLQFFSSVSNQGDGAGRSIRSRSFLRTNRTPRSFTDGRVSSAIHRRTVLTEAPVERVMSAARY